MSPCLLFLPVRVPAIRDCLGEACTARVRSLHCSLALLAGAGASLFASSGCRRIFLRCQGQCRIISERCPSAPHLCQLRCYLMHCAKSAKDHRAHMPSTMQHYMLCITPPTAGPALCRGFPPQCHNCVLMTLRCGSLPRLCVPTMPRSCRSVLLHLIALCHVIDY